ncbi:shufflon system plasmid conjugative transfer pilus tip adhesin PilV [Pseudoduganella namucuonensis]|uniref:Shufflon protein, N-terminal constant region n=1 Tax=Pseudoduganella namucuonensis TaxID=1035707 RepID=A0A1I7L862_9BURK|nr:shufflon system plasmid conjugative transfer pilus tip adhesin PilV [Pseudoduganella namucuonensis]SFV05818.1 shufflon protein, N-terminal constant region [Pseudoduganella namucuonensis]
MHSTKRRQQGMTVIETLAALAVASALLLGLSAMIDTSLDDAKGQQAALHQAQVVDGAHRYITANYADLMAATAGGAVAPVTVAELRAGGFLPDGFSSTNVFSQTSCVLVRQSAAGKLNALVAAFGGTAIPERDLAQVAMQAGQGGGYISAAAPGTARGASWQLATSDYRDVPCGGVTVLTGAAADDGGHLVSSLFYDGPGQLTQDFLYRNAVPGRPELNQMNTPLHLAPGTGAQAVEDDATDPRCTAASGSGKLAVDASGRMLSCQAGVWRRQGSGFWRDPVAAHADLPITGSQTGDTRMVTGLNRAFTWSGAAWEALAVDQNGDFHVPETLTANLITLNQTVTRNAACGTNGTLARDAAGETLSCQSGLWRSARGVRLTNRVYQQGWELVPGDGVRDLTIDLAALPGARPLYVTGYSTCHATASAKAQVSVNMLDTSGAAIAYVGGCLSQLDSAGTGVQNLGDIGLQKIPENITRLHLYMEPGAAAGDYITFVLIIYSE